MNQSKAAAATPAWPAPDDSDTRWDASSWLERSLSPGGDATPGRHAAITRTLYSYANYRTWADKVRTSWDTAGDAKP